jgi:N-acetylglucosaminyl-diphospho-decaprenol L-rhamnosyltransferase
MTSVTVQLVNWNSGPTLCEALESLAQQIGVDVSVIVIDNGSTDDSLRLARAAGHNFELIEVGFNAGYTGGNNVGFGRVDTSAPVLVMNPDARFISADGLAVMLSHLGDEVAAVGPALLATVDGPFEYSGTVCVPNRALVSKRDFLRHQKLPDSSASTVPWLDGAMLLINQVALREVGFFDERYFLFFEEVDWCVRARALGWSLTMARSVEVLHARSTSFGTSKKGTYYYWRNLQLFTSKHGGPTGRLFSLLRALKAVTKSLGRRDESRKLIVIGLADAVRGRYGPGPMDQPAPDACGIP